MLFKTSLKLEKTEESGKRDSEDGDNEGLEQAKSTGTLLEQAHVFQQRGGKVTTPACK